MKKHHVNAKWKRACLQDVAWLAKDLCMTSLSASVSLYNLLSVTEETYNGLQWETAQPDT